MAREKKSMIGFDPLAWLADEEQDVNDSAGKQAESQAKSDDDSGLEVDAQQNDSHEDNTQKNEPLKDEVHEDNVQENNIQENSIQEEEKNIEPEVEKIPDEKAIEVEEMEQESAAPLSDQPAILLNSVQDISKVQELKADILVLIKDNDEIDIVGEAVERIDGSSLQLLCALFDYAEHNALIINWVKPSDALKQAVNLLGMQEELQMH